MQNILVKPQHGWFNTIESSNEILAISYNLNSLTQRDVMEILKWVLEGYLIKKCLKIKLKKFL